MTFQRNKRIYLQIVQNFLQGQLPVDDFIRDYMRQWREDRDAEWKALGGAPALETSTSKFNEATDRAFTACDCYSPNPINQFDISKAQLRAELQGLFGVALRASSAP